MNTLFRFSESLHAVESFRQMWRALDSTQAEDLVASEAPHKSPITNPHVTVPVNEENTSESRPRANTLFRNARSKSKQILETCRHCIAENVTPALNALNDAVDGVLSAFKPSGKEHGPGAGRYGEEL